MYILKNALRNIARSKGRSILIGIIIMIIALSLCIGLCIRQSAVNAKEAALEDLTVTAQISPDREAAMDKAGGGDGNFDKSQLRDAMSQSLSLSELEKYAEAKSVKSFYYSLTSSLDASGSLEAYSTSSESSDSSGSNPGNSFRGKMMESGDFQLVGYSSDEAMTSFVDGTCTITDGKVFEENTSENVCIISDELAEYNDLKVGDTMTLANPSNEDETYKLKVVGIYKNSQSSANAAGGMGGGGFVDPANNIYTGYKTLNNIVSKSEAANESDDDTSAISGRLSGTYVLGDMDAYESFQKEVSDIGLEDGYVVSSEDLSRYEQSAAPLENLSKFAGYFLIVIFVIGAVILVVLNIFSTRERKYEIGVLTAIGMKKNKVAKLFVSEIMIIALAGTIIGGAIGAVASVPVTNSLLASQIESQQENAGDRDQAFGRGFNGGEQQAPPNGSNESGESSDASTSATSVSVSTKTVASTDNSNDQVQGRNPGMSYISSVSSAVNLVVLLELLVCCIILAAVAGAVSVIAIMRYEPMEILANRD